LRSSFTGDQLRQMDAAGVVQSVQQGTIFSNLSAKQKTKIVNTLLHSGERVAIVGDSVADIPAMTAADLSLTLQQSSQAALRTADIVLLKSSLDVIPTVLENCQQIVNGMLDILKVNLVQIGYVLLLLIAMLVTTKDNFYYHPTHGGVIVFLTIIFPSLGLTFWATAGAVPRQYMRLRILHFVVPAAMTMALAVIIINYLAGRGDVDVAYLQQVNTYGLIMMGLLLIIFVEPPTRFWVGGDILSGNWRNPLLVLGLFLLFVFARYLPITQELLLLSPLRNPVDTLIIGIVVVFWLFILRSIWRTSWLSRYVGILSKRLEGELENDAERQ